MQSFYQKPRIGFALGDQAGIGPEIVLKLLCRPHFYDRCQPVLIGNYELLLQMAQRVYPDCLLTPYQPDEAMAMDWNKQDSKGVPVVNIGGDVEHVILGMVTNASGQITCESIKTGYALLEKGVIEGLILAPSTKEAISKSGCGFHSEYEILEHCAGMQEIQTAVKGGDVLRMSAVGHVPFRDITKILSEERIVQTGRRLADVIRRVRGEEPRILMASLNAAEDGAYGEEEQELIVPAICQLGSEGIEVLGPLPAESLIGKALREGYNGIVFMYHDQGNIAMKAQMFQTTACIYTNLPYPVLSTGHGSALDIADLGVANPTNISYVLTVTTDMIQRKRAEKNTALQKAQ